MGGKNCLKKLSNYSFFSSFDPKVTIDPVDAGVLKLNHLSLDRYAECCGTVSDVVLVFLLLTLNRFETDVSIVDFEQVNAG